GVQLPPDCPGGHGLLDAADLDRPGSAGPEAGGDKGPLIVVTVSGGGIRAAVWTFVVLTELELAFADKGFDFPAHVRLITGASGGMVGAGYYVATLPPPGDRPPARGTVAAR